MAIIRWDPFRTDFLWPRWIRPFFEEEEEWPELTLTEGLNIYEEGDNIVVEAAAPGIPADKLEVTYEDGVLHIRGEAKETEEKKKKRKVVYRKQMVSSVDYTTYLPRPIDPSKIKAEAKDGVVTITAPIAETAKPKKIPVKVASK